MKASKLMMAMVCCAMAMPVMAQDHAKPEGVKKDAKVAQPAGDKKGAMPAMSEQDKAWMAAATPGEMHAWIAKSEGKWDLKVKTMMPDQPVVETKGTATTTMMMDGRFAHTTVTSEMKMGEVTMPFTGAGTLGYNNVTKQFESTWVDNMGTMTMFSTGTLDAAKKVLSLSANVVCPLKDKACKFRSVMTLKSDNEMLQEFYSDMMGEDTKMMEITYTRAKGADKEKDAMDKMKGEAEKVKKQAEDAIKQVPAKK